MIRAKYLGTNTSKRVLHYFSSTTVIRGFVIQVSNCKVPGDLWFGAEHSRKLEMMTLCPMARELEPLCTTAIRASA